MKLKDQIDIIMLKYQYEILNHMDEVDSLCLRVITDLIKQDFGSSMVMYDSKKNYLEISIYPDDSDDVVNFVYPINVNFTVNEDEDEEQA